MKIICIYPIDETTRFLNPVYNSLAKLDTFIGYKIQDGQDETYLISDIDKSPDGTVVVFLGHGASYCLYKNNYNLLIDDKNFHIFTNKKIFLFACRSAEFINANNHIPLMEGIGFGNMITDSEEYLVARNGDINAYPNLNDEIIILYKQFLTEILSLELPKVLGASKSFPNLYFQMKLLFNKKISEVLKERKHSYYRTLADLLYVTKCEMTIY